jgi:hypothetical protein
MARLLFTSSRDGVTEADVEAALRPRFAPGKTLVTGGARGGDQIAERLWRGWGGGPVDSHPVSPEAWQRSRGAGYARNSQMVAEVQASAGGECQAVIARCADPSCERNEPLGTHGAAHCAGLAEAAGLPVTRVKARVAAPESDTAGGIPAEPAGRHGRYYPPGAALPEGICPGCRSSALTARRDRCQACGVMEAMAAARQQSAEYPDLSHSQPGHMCVLPGAGRDAEAGS